MKKIYSIVLMATALLIGTNAWANDVFDDLASQQGENTVKVTIGGTTKYAADLQTAVNAVAAGDTATIQLLAAQLLEAPVIIPKVETAETDNEKVANRARQIITLDLNGKNIEPATGYVGAAIMLFKGELNVIGSGQISRSGDNAGGNGNFTSAAIVVLGADGDKRSGYTDRSKQEWSTLTIGENVTVSGAGKWVASGENRGAYGIAIQNFTEAQGQTYVGSDLGYYTYYASNAGKDKLWWKGANSGAAFGVKIDIKGTVYGFYRGINVVGTINQAPEDVEGHNARISDVYPFYEHNYPYVKVEHDAMVYCSDKFNETEVLESGNGGIYGGGWCIYDIAGDVHGQTGVYLKAGDAAVTGEGHVYSSSDKNEKNGNYHGNVAGNGIFISSASNYAGGTNVAIEDNAVVEGNGGAAIIDVLADNANGQSKVSDIEIKGGTIKGGEAGAIVLTPATAEGGKATVYDVNLEGNTNVETGTTNGLLDLLVKDENGDANAYVTTTQDASGNTVLVVTSGAGSAPAVVANDFDIDNFNNLGDVNLSDAGLSNKNQVFDSETKSKLEIGTLMMSNTTDVVKLTIAAGHTIVAQKVIMSPKAQIIVEPGATLIVTGHAGINATSVNNIVLKASETAQATFLFNPSVTSNRHPAATVEFISKSFRVNSTTYLYQRFGIPTFGALSNITAKKANGDEVRTAFALFNGNDWELLGALYASGFTMDYSKMANPFEYYQMLNYNPEAGTIVTMQGELYGNESPTLNIQGGRYNGFANSFMAPIDGQVLIDMIPETVDRTFYLNRISSTEAAWDSYTLMNLDEMPNIAAMQPFLIRNENAAANVNVDYGDAVYYPTTGETKPASAGAPRRLSPAMSDITKIKLYVRGEGSYDRLVVAEDAQFTPQFDNGYDAVKYMNEGINMYVTADKHMSIFATDNLEDTYVGFQSVKGGEYTIEFANVQGEGMTLVDLETGARTLMVEGNTYTFNAAANTTNDYRFQIINTNGIMTGIENAEAAKSAKGIYTITGIYVGEMNLWNTLPAGVYVVNGEKRVK